MPTCTRALREDAFLTRLSLPFFQVFLITTKLEKYHHAYSDIPVPSKPNRTCKQRSTCNSARAVSASTYMYVNQTHLDVAMVALSKYGQPNVLALAQLPFPPARRHSQADDCITDCTGTRRKT